MVYIIPLFLSDIQFSYFFLPIGWMIPFFFFFFSYHFERCHVHYAMAQPVCRLRSEI